MRAGVSGVLEKDSWTKYSNPIRNNDRKGPVLINHKDIFNTYKFLYQNNEITHQTCMSSCEEAKYRKPSQSWLWFRLQEATDDTQ